MSGSEGMVVDCTASLSGKTGAEKEALIGTTVAALTIYDMCKAFSYHIIIKVGEADGEAGGRMILGERGNFLNHKKNSNLSQ